MINHRSLIIVLLGCLVLLPIQTVLQADQNFYISEYLYQKGDDQSWKLTNYDDQQWLQIYDGLPEDTGVYWARIHVQVSNSGEIPQIIYSSLLGSYELYWDGEQLSENGKVANSKSSEVVGQINFYSAIPKHLWTEGEHVLSLRISNYHSAKNYRSRYFNIQIDSYNAITTAPYINSLVPLMLLGGLIIIAIYFLQLYVVYARDPDYLLFSILCFCVSALLIAESWQAVLGYTYDWHHVRSLSANALSVFIALLLPLFFLYQFNIKQKFHWLVLLFFTLLVILWLTTSIDLINLRVIVSSFVISLFITIQAILLNRQGAWLASLAIAVVTLINLLLPFSYQIQYFYPSFGLLIIIVLTSLSQKMKATQLQRNAALLNSASLEISLLKRNIQPHFILNTLTSIEQWIEENPQVAIKFIDALADEFRVLNSMSEQKLVTLQDEIELCNSHLKIMSYRKDQSYKLELDIFNAKQLIPPAIIHTLLENALTHNINDAATSFTLTQQQKDKMVVLSLTTPLGINTKTKVSADSSGTGLKYIRARLEESFSEDWTLTQGTNGTEDTEATNWITHLTIPLRIR